MRREEELLIVSYCKFGVSFTFCCCCRLDDVSDDYPGHVGTAIAADMSSRLAAALPLSLRLLFPALLWASKQLASVRLLSLKLTPTLIGLSDCHTASQTPTAPLLASPVPGTPMANQAACHRAASLFETTSYNFYTLWIVRLSDGVSDSDCQSVRQICSWLTCGQTSISPLCDCLDLVGLSFLHSTDSATFRLSDSLTVAFAQTCYRPSCGQMSNWQLGLVRLPCPRLVFCRSRIVRPSDSQTVAVGCVSSVQVYTDPEEETVLYNTFPLCRVRWTVSPGLRSYNYRRMRRIFPHC